MLQNRSDEIREDLERAESAGNAQIIAGFLDMANRWLSLARSYKFAERLSIQEAEDTAAVSAFRPSHSKLGPLAGPHRVRSVERANGRLDRPDGPPLSERFRRFSG